MELDEIIKKIDNKQELEEEEIKTLLWETEQVYEEEGEDHRWTRDVFTVVRVNERLFGIAWLRGLTECQEHEFYEQPYEVGCETELKTVSKQIWKPIAEVKKEDNQLIVVKQLPLIEEHLKQLADEIDKKVKNALSLVCNEETRKSVKEVRADLNKQFTELEEKRKDVKKAVLDPYNKFEEIYKKCVTEKFKNADGELKNKIDIVENGIKDKAKQEAINYFNEYAASLKIDFVKFEDMNLTINLNTSKTSIKKSIEEFINKRNMDLGAIELQEHKEEKLGEYKQNGYNLNNAITTVLNRIEKIKAEKERQEQLAKQKEVEAQTVAKVEEVATVEEPLQAPVTIGVDTGEGYSKPAESMAEIQPKPAEEKLYTMKFTVQGTIEQLKAIKEFLEKEGIRYE